MSLKKYLEKVATTDYAISRFVNGPRNPLAFRMQGGSTIADYKDRLRSTTDPALKDQAVELADQIDHVTKKDKGVQQALKYLEPKTLGAGNMPTAFFYPSPNPSEFGVAATINSEGTLSHELTHAMDLKNRKHGMKIEKPRPMLDPRGQLLKTEGTSSIPLRKMGFPENIHKVVGRMVRKRQAEGNPMSKAEIDKLLNRVFSRERLIMESIANQGMLDAYKPWRERKSLRDLTPQQRKVVADNMAAYSTYLESSPFTSHSGLKESQEMAKVTPESSSKISRLQAIQKKVDEARWRTDPKKHIPYTPKDLALDRQYRYSTNTSERLGNLIGKIRTNTNPFVDRGAWKNMSKADRISYIAQIKQNAKNIASDPRLGADAAMVYKAEMMRALRKML